MLPKTDRRQWSRATLSRWIGPLKGRPMTDLQEMMPPLKWRELEAVFHELAPTEAKKRMVRHLVEGTRKQAVFLTPTAVMTEVAYIAAAMLDANFCPSETEADASEAFWSSSASPPQRPGS